MDRRRHPGEEDRDDRDDDEGVRQQVDRHRLRVGGVTGDDDAVADRGLRPRAQHVAQVEDAQLLEHHGTDGPADHGAGRAQPDAAQAQAEAPPEAGAAQRDDEDQRLRGDAQRRGAGEQRRLRRAPRGQVDDAVVGCAAPDEQEGAEPEERDHVVGDRCEAVRAELPLGVQHLAQQHIEAVEEDLGDAPVGEDGREVPRLGRPLVAGRVEPHDEGRRDDQHRREQQEAEAGEAEQLVEPLAGVVRVHRPQDLRDEHGLEHAGGDEREQHVRQLVRDVEGVGDGAHRADTGHQQHGADEPRGAGRYRAERHHDGAAAEAGAPHGVGAAVVAVTAAPRTGAAVRTGGGALARSAAGRVANRMPARAGGAGRRCRVGRVALAGQVGPAVVGEGGRRSHEGSVSVAWAAADNRFTMPEAMAASRSASSRSSPA